MDLSYNNEVDARTPGGLKVNKEQCEMKIKVISANAFSMTDNPEIPSAQKSKVGMLVADVVRIGEFWTPADIFFKQSAKYIHSFLCLARVGDEVVTCIIEVPADAISALVVPDERVTFKNVQYQSGTGSEIPLFKADSVSFK